MQENSLVAARNLFIRRWGEMGASWGISRTMAELHALLYISTAPLNADEIMEQLQISRGNASMNLRQLVNWGLIERIHQRGDRKEYFQAQTDVWQMFETIIRERRRREVEPVIEAIQRCLDMVESGKGKLDPDQAQAAAVQKKRFEEIIDFCDVSNTMFNLMIRIGRRGLKPLIQTMSKLVK